MAVPHDQEIRQQRFTRDHLGWPIHAPDGAPRLTAGKGGSRSAPIAAARSLRELPGRPTRPGTADDRSTAPGAACVCRARSQQGTGADAYPAAGRLRPRRAYLPLARPGRTGHRQSCRRPVLPDPHRQRAGPLALRATRLPASASTLAAIITHILGAPHAAGSSPGVGAYRAFPVKGAVGRSLHDRGLTVTLQVSEDWDSFEATTSIDITSPARPWLGTVHLTDDGHLDWECDWRAAFHGDPAQIADIIPPATPGKDRKKWAANPQNEPEILPDNSPGHLK